MIFVNLMDKDRILTTNELTDDRFEDVNGLIERTRELLNRNNIAISVDVCSDTLRQCDICGKLMQEGYHADGTYYCSDECLSQDYTKEEWEKAYDNDNSECYWTSWAD